MESLIWYLGVAVDTMEVEVCRNSWWGFTENIVGHGVKREKWKISVRIFLNFGRS